MHMMRRREAIVRLGSGFVALPGLISTGAGRATAAQGGRGERSAAIDRPIAFNTPEADRILAGLRVFPADNPWNRDISDWPAHPNSGAIVASIGTTKPLRYNPDMSFVLVPPGQRRVPVRITEYAGESDRGPFPVPEELAIEGWPAWYASDPRLKGLSLAEVQRDERNVGGDRHAIVVDPVGRVLYEFLGMRRAASGWEALQASVFDLKTNRLRPEGWTSADAAGLPVFPGVVRHDELARGKIGHAMRVTVRRSRRSYVGPARHFASRSEDPDLPRMGERLRLRRSFDVSGFTPPVRTILEGLKRHGMFVADNGIEWAISVAPDERIPPLHEELRKVTGSDFEVVQAPR